MLVTNQINASPENPFNIAPETAAQEMEETSQGFGVVEEQVSQRTSAPNLHSEMMGS